LTTAKRVKDAKIEKKFEVARAAKAARPKFSTRKHNRCQICGRPRAYMRKFGICRLCFRGLALRGEIPGVAKSSW
jgi:small subunit ribosomal protein S14